MQPRFKINFIGSGNVATALAQELFAKNLKIEKIYSRNIENSTNLCKKINALPAQSVSEIEESSDIIIISINDDCIEDISSILNTNALVVHTAGSVHMNTLAKHAKHGVFYPMQTFSKDKSVHFQDIPLFVEANNSDNLEILQNLGNLISGRVQELSSEDRILLHISAVFSCNFANHMYHLAEQLMQKTGVDFNLLMPLIEETAKKLQYLSPADAQTGPAARKDENILEKHLESLDLLPKHKEIYSLVSKSIMENRNA